MTLDIGMPAPDFSLPAAGGATASLSALRGRPAVLYFYPKADTSGCTAEACAFQEALPQFAEKGVAVIGVSRDKMRPIERFAEKYNLSFPLASDPEGQAAALYGAWVEKSMYGRKYMAVERSTFLIDRNGALARIWRKVKVEGHAAEVLQAAAAL